MRYHIDAHPAGDEPVLGHIHSATNAVLKIGDVTLYVPAGDAAAWLRRLAVAAEDLAEQVELAAAPKPEPDAAYYTEQYGDYTLTVLDNQPVPEGKKHAPEMYVTVTRGSELVRGFLYPSYRIWTLVAHWKDGLAPAEPEPLPSSVSEYHCRYCDARFGIAGTSTGSDDYAAEEYYRAEVERHESGECAPGAALAERHMAEAMAKAGIGGQR